MSLNYLVTGAAGFIGSHVSDSLLARGDNVVGLDNLNNYYSVDRKISNLREIEDSGHQGQFIFVEGDIRDRDLISRLFQEHDFRAVVHLAALAGVRQSIEDPDAYFDVNVQGTVALLDATVTSGTPHFVLASTSAVYGETDQIPFKETDPCARPLVPYSASKRSAEIIGYTYHHLYELSLTVLRFFTVYGPRGRPDMMAYKLADSIRLGTEVPLYNDGDMFRDWTFISDIVDGVVKAADRTSGYEIINLGRGEPVRLGDFAELIQEMTGGSARLIKRARPPGDVLKTAADITKARDLLGYNPTVSVREGVRKFLDWYESVAD